MAPGTERVRGAYLVVQTLYTREVLRGRLRHANARTAPVAFAPRRVSHLVFLISLVLEQTSEDCIGNIEHTNKCERRV